MVTLFEKGQIQEERNGEDKLDYFRIHIDIDFDLNICERADVHIADRKSVMVSGKELNFISIGDKFIMYFKKLA